MRCLIEDGYLIEWIICKKKTENVETNKYFFEIEPNMLISKENRKAIYSALFKGEKKKVNTLESDILLT